MWNMILIIFFYNKTYHTKIIMNTVEKRKKDFYNKLDLSPVTLSNYRSALNGRLLQEVLAEIDNSITSIFEITDLELLWKIYTMINVHPTNIKNHRGISCAVMKYIRFLNNGKKYGKRIDYKKHRKKVHHTKIGNKV